MGKLSINDPWKKPANPIPQPAKTVPARLRVGFQGYGYGLALDTPGLPVLCPNVRSLLAQMEDEDKEEFFKDAEKEGF